MEGNRGVPRHMKVNRICNFLATSLELKSLLIGISHAPALSSAAPPVSPELDQCPRFRAVGVGWVGGVGGRCGSCGRA